MRSSGTPTAAAAHPRSRGENRSMRKTVRVSPGSSPLTRGKRGVRGACDPSTRLIPAHAGKTSFRSVTATPTAAHPRSRGENTGPSPCDSTSRGSSPLTRGKLYRACVGRAFQRLIPAHAGKTHVRGLGARRRRAHPRSRGENHGPGGQEASHLGSSPLTRGKLWQGRLGSCQERLIPAHAGKTGR